MKLIAFLIPDDVRCQTQQLPVLKKLSKTTGVALEVIDPREQPALAVHYNVPIVPTTVLIGSHNEVCAINHGFASCRTLRAQMAAR